MKRSCNNCRALDIANEHYFCAIGYKVNQVYINNLLIGAKPKEDCPKPKTYNDYLVYKQTT